MGLPDGGRGGLHRPPPVPLQAVPRQVQQQLYARCVEGLRTAGACAVVSMVQCGETQRGVAFHFVLWHAMRIWQGTESSRVIYMDDLVALETAPGGSLCTVWDNEKFWSGTFWGQRMENDETHQILQ